MKERYGIRMCTLIRVGEAFLPGRTQWDEGCDVKLGAQGVHMRIFIASPKKDEIEAFVNGKFHFALFASHGVGFLLHKWDDVQRRPNKGLPWSDASIHIVSDMSSLRQIRAGDGHGAALTITLVDAATGICKGIKLISLSNAMSITLAESIASGAIVSRPTLEHNVCAQRVYLRYTSTVSMLPHIIAKFARGDK